MSLSPNKVSSPIGNRMIIYASTVDVSAPNGPGVNEREFVHALMRRFGSKVHFVLPEPATQDALNGIQCCASLFRRRSNAQYLLYQLDFLKTLRRATRRLQPGLVIARAPQLPLGLAAFARGSEFPIALKTQGDPTMKYLCDQPGAKGWVSRRLRGLNIRLARILADRAILIDCCTPQLIRRNIATLGAEYSDKFALVENATNVERFRPISRRECRAQTGVPRDAFVVGYVGGAPWERGGGQIIDAVAALRTRHPRIHGVIVGGKGPGLEQLRKRVRALRVAERCRIVGQVPYDDVPAWVGSFDIGVAMDLVERLDYVGSSNQKIRQYLACGKPVVASAGVNDFLDAHDLGSTVLPTDISTFTELVDAYAMQTEERKREHTLRARRYATENFSIDTALDIRLELWRDLGVELDE